MTYSTEILTHFRCAFCESWWTVADYHVVSQQFEKRYCPNCGNEQSNTCVARDQIEALQAVIVILQEQVCVE